MELELPDYFEKADELEFNHLRIMYNRKKFKYYYIVKYQDLYQAYQTVQEFKLFNNRINFEYNTNLRNFVIQKSLTGIPGHNDAILDSFSIKEDNFTFVDYFVCKEWYPLSLFYDANTVNVKVDEYLTISKRWVSDVG